MYRGQGQNRVSKCRGILRQQTHKPKCDGVCTEDQFHLKGTNESDKSVCAMGEGGNIFNLLLGYDINLET